MYINVTSNSSFEYVELIKIRALQQTKLKLKAANKGKDLLKKKADALKVQFRLILKMLIEVCNI